MGSKQVATLDIYRPERCISTIVGEFVVKPKPYNIYFTFLSSVNFAFNNLSATYTERDSSRHLSTSAIVRNYDGVSISKDEPLCLAQSSALSLQDTVYETFGWLRSQMY